MTLALLCGLLFDVVVDADYRQRLMKIPRLELFKKPFCSDSFLALQ